MNSWDEVLRSAAAEPISERVESLAGAARRWPREGAVLLAWGVALKESGRMDDAVHALQRAVQARPDLAAAYALLAQLLGVQNKLDRSAHAWETALRLDAGQADWWSGYGETLAMAGRIDAARRAYHHELGLRPCHGRTLVDMGRTFECSAQLAEAERWFRQAITRAPQYAPGWHRLGTTLGKLDRLAEALPILQKATELSDAPGVWHDFALAHERSGHFAQAEQAYRRTAQLRPGDVVELTALARCLRFQDRLADALATLDRALEIDPKNTIVCGERAVITLLLGDFSRGWDEYECRYDAPDFPGGKRLFDIPRWCGQPLNGKTIMLWCEQGLGDAIHFLRYVPLVTARGGRVVLEVPEGLERLARDIPGVQQVIRKGQAWPACDAQIGLMSLAWICKTVEATIPREIPYLHVDPLVRGKWAARLGPRSAKRRIGLVWAGSWAHPNDKQRSMTLETLHPLFDVADIEWFSLQKGVAENQLAGAGSPLRNFMGDATDFMETAALIEQLDLVIGVDTSVVHLAGALGKPVWVLLPRTPDWRWMIQREDSPWYPTMRLFRQTSEVGWPCVIRKIHRQLAGLL